MAGKVTTLATQVIRERGVDVHRAVEPLTEDLSVQLSDLRVIVVGAATGGASAALLLARAGARVTLIERVAQPRAVGAGIGLAENGLAVLESLGLGPALDCARELHGVRVTDAAGRTLLVPANPPPRVAMIRRATLQEVLLDAVAAEPNIQARFGCEALSVLRDGRVIVRSGDDEETLSADLVVGADGVHSRVRASGEFGARERSSGIRYVRALVEGAEPLGVEAWTSAGLFGSFGTDNGAYLYASCGTPALRDAVARGDLDAFRRVWTRAYPAAAALLNAIPSWNAVLVNEVREVECARFADTRLVLVGDAAHAMAPNLGQGANSALVDAAVLCQSLHDEPSLTAALAAYDARRRPAVRTVAQLAARLGALAEVTHPVLRLLRDRVLMPIAARLQSPESTRRVMQEPTSALRALTPAPQISG